MPSPFPGVDPFLESQGLWPDFHSEFVSSWRNALLDRLPPSYDARLDERVWLERIGDDDEAADLVLPDVAVAAAVEVLIEPVTVSLPGFVEVREPYIRITKREDRSLVAILELLSPSNKHNPGFGQYVEKRNEIIGSTVHLIELDLLIGGQRLPMARPLPPAHYYALISRGDRRPDSTVYAWTVRHCLPTIPVPLLSPDPDVTINLNAVFATAWQRGRYERAINYTERPELSLAEPHLRWVVQRAASQEGHGGRTS
ncbi:MAG: DUF4058 family protein [Planctomycetaceae bacterium]